MQHIPAEAYAGNNRTSIGRQRNSKQASSAIEKLCSAWSVPKGYKGTKKVVSVSCRGLGRVLEMAV
jgi:hypothetical protein